MISTYLSVRVRLHSLASKQRMDGKPITNLPRVLFLGLFSFQLLFTVNGRTLVVQESKPNRDNVAGYARWLVAQNSWGVLSTISVEMDGAPFGNVLSYSDGVPGDGQGMPYFYLTRMDPTARNADKDQRASFTISEVPIGTCGSLDPMEPPCAKLTLTGKLGWIQKNSSEATIAMKALFSKHPVMGRWPKGHDFEFYKLNIENVFLINWYGGHRPVTVEEYLSYNTMEQLASASKK